MGVLPFLAVDEKGIVLQALIRTQELPVVGLLLQPFYELICFRCEPSMDSAVLALPQVELYSFFLDRTVNSAEVVLNLKAR